MITNEALNMYGNYYTVPNAIYNLGLSAGAIAVYCFLLRLECRKPGEDQYTCHPSMQNGILADVCKLPEEEMRRRRAESVKNVKYTNGSISLEQRMRESDAGLDDEEDEWQG